jgi:novel protein kinase C epsilon type
MQDDDEEKINHRIPHRFEPLTNIGANWCCHCGYMMSLGRKNARKCSECGVTCHAYCAHLVPDFCGMSMETANQILTDWRDINRARGGKKAPTPGHGSMHSPQQSQQSYQQPTPISPRQSPEAAIGRLPSDMGGLKLDAGGPVPPSVGGAPPDPFAAAAQRPPSAQSDVRYVPQQPLPGSGSQTPRPPPGARPPAQPQYPYEQQIAQQQPPQRPSSAYERVQQQQDVYSPQAGYSVSDGFCMFFPSFG